MRTAVLLAAGALVAAVALLGAATPPVGDALAANAWLVPMPRLDIFMGPEEENVGKDPEEGPTGTDPPPPPVLYRTLTTITESPARIEKGESFVVEGTVVVASTQEPVRDAVIQLYLNETKAEPGFRVAKGRTDDEGRFRIEAQVPPILEARPYQIVAEAIDTLHGRVLYLGSFSDPDTAVYSATHLTYHHPKSAALGVPVYFEGRIRDATGGPVRGVVIVLTIDDLDVTTAVTDDQGWFRLTHTFETPGRHDVQVRYDGSEYYYSSSDQSIIVVGGVGLEIHTAESVVHGERLDVTGLVVGDAAEAAGVDVRATFVNLSVEPDSTLDLVSDDAGQWKGTVTVPRDTPPGRYTIRYSAPSLRFSEERTLRVEAESNLTLKMPTEIGEDGRATGFATLLDDDGNPLAERLVALRVADERVRSWTDENGTVRFDVTIPGGPHDVRATFDGDAMYRGSTDRVDVVVAVPLQERARPWLLFALGAVAVAAALAWLLRPRGRRAVRRAVAALDPREALQLEIDLPGVETDLPDVWGVGEPLGVVARASAPQGPPATGLDLVLEMGARTHVRTGDDGRVHQTVSFAVEGVAELVVRFAGDPHRRPAETTRPVRIVDYRRVIEEGFEEMRAALAELGVAVHGATPPRELERCLRAALPTLPADDLDRLLTLFEVSDYSPHPIGRADWITFHRTKAALGHAVAEVTPRAA